MTDMQNAIAEANARYDEVKGRNLSLDMTRGKPSAEQLSLSDALLTNLTDADVIDEDGTDLRNYGGLVGIPAARKLFGDYLGIPADQTVICGNSSLQVMYGILLGAVDFGVPGGSGPWKDQDAKVICPVPGYDRHFAVCERLGLSMIPVPMEDDGPNMDAVEAVAADDDSVKAIWCVPKYSNPTGATYSDEVAERLASMKAAPDFRILWDNAYNAHHLGQGLDSVPDILALSEKAGNPDRPILIGSTSKMTYAGAGLAFLGGSAANIADQQKRLSFETIGPDKINQIRQVKFFQDQAGIAAHMDKHADVIKPKFDAVEEIMTARLGGKGLATWTKPKGGYFVSVDLLPGTAKEVVRLAGEAGVKLTPAGACFPYGDDPEDKNLRIAPTLPPLDEVRQAMDVFCTCVEKVGLPKLEGSA